MGLTSDNADLHARAVIHLETCPDDIVVALAGNPNTGKSTLFNAITKLNQHTGNWPGKTVESACGTATHGGKHFVLIDLPGTYSLAAKSPEEEIARDFLSSKEADCTIVVADATCLERNLNLALQVSEMFPKTILCLNLMDEAKSRNIEIDVPQLSRLLGIMVIPCTARTGEGISDLLDAVALLAAQKSPPKPTPIPYPESATNPAYADEKRAEIRTKTIVLRAEEIANMVVHTRENIAANRDRKIDRILTSRATGFPVMLLLLAGVLFLTIAGANYPSELLSNVLFRAVPLFSAALSAIHTPAWLHSMLIDGVWRVLATVVSVMLPPMAIFFPIFTLLEDVGYLPRVAFNLDHAFCRARTCGKQALTMCIVLPILHPTKSPHSPQSFLSAPL